MRSKRFNNVPMLKENMARLISAPYVAEYVKQQIAAHQEREMQKFAPEDEMEIVFIPDETAH